MKVHVELIARKAIVSSIKIEHKNVSQICDKEQSVTCNQVEVRLILGQFQSC
jgi:hypothetical protein